MNSHPILAVLLATASCAGCTTGQWPQAPTGMPATGPGPTTAVVTAQIPRYDRVPQFGGGWIDVDRDGCNTKEEAVARDAGGSCPPDPGPNVIITDPYTGERVAGWSEIDGEHVVSLRDAYYSGAHAWTKAQRVAFANDLTSHVPGCPRCSQVVASSDDVNRAKSDEDPSEWRGDQPSWCWHATTYQAAKQHWGLVITSAQQTALDDMLNTCGGTR